MQQYSNEKENHFAYVGKMVFSEIGFMLLPFYYSYLLLCFFMKMIAFMLSMVLL